MKFHKHSSQPAELNLTPLIDVVFVILIMFIVIAPLLEIQNVELATGSKMENGMTLAEQSAIALHVHKDNSIQLNGQPVALKDLPRTLSYAKQRFPAACPQLLHDRNASFGTYQSIKNALEAAGFSEMDVLVKPE